MSRLTAEAEAEQKRKGELEQHRKDAAASLAAALKAAREDSQKCEEAATKKHEEQMDLLRQPAGRVRTASDSELRRWRRRDGAALLLNLLLELGGQPRRGRLGRGQSARRLGDGTVDALR